jgi:ATP phosphoribosyltransferase
LVGLFLWTKIDMEKIKIAIQKSGRLYDDSIQLLSKCGINIKAASGKLKAEASNFPIEVLFLRDDDIPQYVEDGVADIGIVGLNVIQEKNKSINNVLALGFSKCRLSIATPKDVIMNFPEDLEGKRIATTYKNILQKYLDEQKIVAEIHELSGSVEIAPSIGLADAICDLVSTGSTLLTNGLVERFTILKSEAYLVGNKNISKEKQTLIDKLLFRINAVQTAENNKYILMNAPNQKLNDIIKVLPGMKSPTVLPLAIEGWSSVHSVINENDFWNIIEKLKESGAEGILVVPIEKMIV